MRLILDISAESRIYREFMPSRYQTYVKQLHPDTDAGLFLADYAAISREASVVILKGLLKHQKKSKLNTAIQDEFGINKRHAAGIIAFVEGEMKSAEECLAHHVLTLEDKIKFLKSDVESLEKKVNTHKAYLNALCEVNRKIKSGKKARLAKKYKPQFEDACSIKFGRKCGTHYQSAKHKLHQLKRNLATLSAKVARVKSAELHVKLGNREAISFVGSKDESNGNQVCQLILMTDDAIQIRVPSALEQQYGKYVEIPVNLVGVGSTEIRQAWAEGKAITFRLRQRQYGVWEAHITVDVYRPITSSSVMLGCLGVDLNTGSIAWCKVNSDGNPTRFSQIAIDIHSKSSGQTEAILADAVTKLTSLALALLCPIVVEQLDFAAKKAQLKSGTRHKRYNRMLSGFAYRRFQELLSSRCFKLGIKLIAVKPEYSTLIGLVKFQSMYGMNSGTAAALVLARRAMNYSEAVPARTAFADMESKRHIWSYWNAISQRVKGSARHSFFQPRLTASSSLRTGVEGDPPFEHGNSVVQLTLWDLGLNVPSHQASASRKPVRESS